MDEIPEKKFSARPISATVWTTRQGEGISRKVSLRRLFKDREGAWQSTNMLRLNDMPKAAMLLNEAYRYLTSQAEEDLEVEEDDSSV